MLKMRVIPCLDVKDGRVVKGVNFVDLVDAGDPVVHARFYDREGADELCFLDITASSEERDTLYDLVRRTAEQCFMPLTVGGGVRAIEDIRRLLLAGAVIDKPPRPINRIDAGRPPAAMGKDFPPGGSNGFSIDRADDTLAAEFLRRFAHEFWTRDGGGVDRHLVGAGEQQAANILDRPHSAANGQRHEAFLGGAAHDVIKRVAPFRAGGDVEKAQFVRTFAIVKTRLRHGIAGIDQIDKIYPFDDPSVLDVEARDNSHFQHGGSPAANRNAARGSMRPS